MDAFSAKKYPLESLKKMLIPQELWKPYPTAADRAAWDSLPESARGHTSLRREGPDPRLAAPGSQQLLEVCQDRQPRPV